MTYEEFQKLADDLQDAAWATAIRNERSRPEAERVEAMVSLVKARDAMWDAIRKLNGPSKETP